MRVLTTDDILMLIDRAISKIASSGLGLSVHYAVNRNIGGTVALSFKPGYFQYIFTVNGTQSFNVKLPSPADLNGSIIIVRGGTNLGGLVTVTVKDNNGNTPTMDGVADPVIITYPGHRRVFTSDGTEYKSLI